MLSIKLKEITSATTIFSPFKKKQVLREVYSNIKFCKSQLPILSFVILLEPNNLKIHVIGKIKFADFEKTR